MFENEKIEIFTANDGEELKNLFENWAKKTQPNEISGRYFSYADGKFNLAIFYFL